jgi:kynureninase
VAERERALDLDANDPLAGCRARFRVPDGLIYLDGNSLGALPVGVPAAVARTVEQEWGVDLIGSWNSNGWWDAPRRVGDRVGTLIGAAPGQVVACDSTSVNLYKLVVAARRLRPDRPGLVIDADDFPTDRYIVGAVAGGSVAREIGPDTGVVVRSHVNYQSGRLHDLRSVTAAVHDAGAVVLWDLSHSAGVVPVELDAAGVDLAVGCTYKYLNGGPGSPAFAYVAARHQDALRQPLAGWTGHAQPFAMGPEYEPAPGVSRVLTGTPPIVAMAALEAALDAFDGVAMADVRAKSIALTALFIELVEERFGAAFALASPRLAAERGGHVSFAHPEAYAIKQALIARHVVPDFREPDLVRFGFAPLYIRFVDVWDAVDRLAAVMAGAEWDVPAYRVRAAVT